MLLGHSDSNLHPEIEAFDPKKRPKILQINTLTIQLASNWQNTPSVRAYFLF